MQNPPGSPPPGPPSGPPPGQPGQPYGQQPARSSGVDTRTGSFLAYVLWWLTGIVMLFVGKDDADIKYHAAQSIVFFGAYSVVQVILSFLGAALGTAIGFIIGLVSLVLAIYALVVWILSMVWAWQRGGARFEIPLVGNFVARYAEQLAASVK